MNGELLFRKSVRNLMVEQLAALRQAYRGMMEISDNRSYNYIAGFHGAPGYYCWHHQGSGGVFEGVRMFLPWHRAYLYRFEQAAQDIVEGVTIPWWDWTSDVSHQEGVPKAFSDETTPAGEPNPLFKSHVSVPNANPPIDKDTRRFPGDPGNLPSRDTFRGLLSIQDWADFNDQLEEVHDSIHPWTGGMGFDNGNRVFGDMGAVTTAAFDPIFWSHHCMVDRIWWLWQLRHGNSGMPPNFLDIVLEPFNLQVRDVLNIQDLGYDYAGSEVSTEGGG